MRIALVLALLAGCTQPRSKTCVDICARENDCINATKSEVPFDEKECVVALKGRKYKHLRRGDVISL